MLKTHITTKDLDHWAWILRAGNADLMVERFLQDPCVKPDFILVEILRRDLRNVDSLRMLLQELVPRKAGNHTGKPQSAKLASELIRNESLQHDNSFGILVSRLLYQARRIWPAAVVTVTHLVYNRFATILNTVTDSNRTRVMMRLTRLLNSMIVQLSHPATLNPLASTRHVWEGQKKMLELAGSFDPPLLLSQNGYRAVVKTLVASKKSTTESKSVLLRTKSWPPWRRDQDGMDAARLLEEDYSRVVSAISKMQEAGFRLNTNDETARVYGGMEFDGTPTIQTRRILRKPSIELTAEKISSQSWIARIEATRNLQEAWGAFLEYKTRGGTPTQRIYLAMFEKIDYDAANGGRKRPHTAPPGDGKEVNPVSNINFTESYIQRIRPPTLSKLYAEMLAYGIRPSGRCLNFLIARARTSDEGVRYLLDSGVEPGAVATLIDSTSPASASAYLARIPDRTLCSYVELICRLAPRIVSQATVEQALMASQPKKVTSSINGATIAETQNTHVSIRGQEGTRRRHVTNRETFNHVSYLLRYSSTMFRPTWYAYFRALAREGAILSWKVVGNVVKRWDSLTWNRLVGALKDFHSLGLELDPQGFHWVCVAFEKMATEALVDGLPRRSLGRSPKTTHKGLVMEGAKLIKDEFAKLSKSQKDSNQIPVLLHSIRGVHLHAYIRALGAIDDHEAIIGTLKWMVAHHKELEAIAEENRNGMASYHRVIVAIRYLLSGTAHEGLAMTLVEKVDWWGSWPSEHKVVAYLGTSKEVAEEDEGHHSG